MKTGVANLPLHYGSTPSWLFEKMKRLSREIICIIVEEYGAEEVLKRISDPYWFQSLGCVLGFDWHSSGLTTTVCGALKEGIRGIEKDLGIFIVGGKGQASRKVPYEIEALAQNYGFNSESLIYASRMSAKIDNTALQDGYQLYHHSFIFLKNGQWAVIQQGMNTVNRMARRYHWLSLRKDQNFINEPHKAVCCDLKNQVLNLVARESQKVRQLSTFLAKEEGPFLLKDLRLIVLNLPRHHPVYSFDFDLTHLKKILTLIQEQQPDNFEKLLGIKGVGPRTIQALSLISEVIYGAQPSFRDPVRYSFAHGGKDGYPYPIDKEVYNQSIQILQKAIHKAKIAHREKIQALKKLIFI